MRILIASSGFKESLPPDEVADAIARGILKAAPEAVIYKAPLVDGGEGFTQGLVTATHGVLKDILATGPLGLPIKTQYGYLGGARQKTAVLDMASVAGLRLVPRDMRDPLATTTYGVGELIQAALDDGAERILIGLGDSGTMDGGAGAAQALGARLTDRAGKDIQRGGRGLADLAHIDLSKVDPRLKNVRMDVACNTYNILCGPEGVARIFGPQKGASSESIQFLSDAFENYAAVIQRGTGMDVRSMPGGGASGGLGAGLFALLGATLYPRYEIVMQYLDIESLFEKVDLVFSAEGSLDYQTPRGKIPAEIAQRAKKFGLPVIVLAGSVGPGADINYAYGIDSFTSILDKPCSLTEAIENTAPLLESSSERTMRMILVGMSLRTTVP